MIGDQLHLTLQFLGEQPESSIDLIDQAMQQVQINPLHITLSKVGQFRSGVIWLGVSHNPELLQLQRQISHRLQYSFNLQARKYHPHLTLARSKKQLRTEQIAYLSTAFAGQEFSFTPQQINLKQSRLLPEGAQHHIIGQWLIPKN